MNQAAEQLPSRRSLPEAQPASATTIRRRLLIIGPLPPPYAGPEIGTEIFLRSEGLQKHFVLDHINTTVRSSNSEKGKADLTMVFAYVRYLWCLVRALVVFKPDFVLYRPTSATLKGWVRDGTTLLFGSALGAKVVLQFGGGHFRHFYDSLSSVPQGIIALLLRRSCLVLPESQILTRQFNGLVPADRIHDLPTAITEDFYGRFEGIDRSRSGKELTVLFVGHLTQAKGYCDVLKTIPELVARFNVRFRFMGVHQSVERNVFFNQATGLRIEPEDPAECLESFVNSRGLNDRVEFLGDRVFGDAKQKTFESADIFVLPSYSEGFSRAMLEAMAAALPMIVTKVGAVPDIVHDGVSAFVINPGDVGALTERLSRLLSDAHLRLEMGMTGRALCGERFLGEQIARRLTELLSSR